MEALIHSLQAKNQKSAKENSLLRRSLKEANQRVEDLERNLHIARRSASEMNVSRHIYNWKCNHSIVHSLCIMYSQYSLSSDLNPLASTSPTSPISYSSYSSYTVRHFWSHVANYFFSTLNASYINMTFVVNSDSTVPNVNQILKLKHRHFYLNMNP